MGVIKKQLKAKTEGRDREFWSSARVGKENDRRRKLTDADKEYIRTLYSEGKSIHGIAREFQGICTRRAIQFVLFPERDRALKAAVKSEKRWKKYYDRDKRREYMRKHRAHLKALNQKNHGQS